MKQHRRFTVLGQVDKVDFLYYTQMFCIAHKLNGFAKNGKPGRIYVEAEVAQDELDALENYYNNGPLKKYITQVTVEPGEIKNYDGFDLKKDREEKAYLVQKLEGLKKIFGGR